MAIVQDGIDNFSGGMDSSRGPDYIENTQCSKLINCSIEAVGDDLAPRWGMHHQFIDFDHTFDSEAYHNCRHVQGEGWYDDGKGRVLLASIDGWIFEFLSTQKGRFNGRIINRGDRNNPNRNKAWFARVPDGAVMNDGQSNTVFIDRNGASRMDIGVGRMLAYVQNRLCWVSADGKQILIGDLGNIFGITDWATFGITGFTTPEDVDRITAIGKQKTLLRDINGGELVWSTDDNLYSAPITGDRRNWDEPGARLMVAGSGASSGYSFESYNSNLWFRTFDEGIVDFKASATQFIRDSDTTGTSVEVDLWLDRDTPWMLDQCYTRKFNRRLFTTTAPAQNEHGFTYWNGIISMSPDPIFAGRERLPRRFEGLWTGVRPWCLTVMHGFTQESEMYVHSLDRDGVTRLYRIDPESDFDIDANGNRKEIERVGETRSFAYDSRLQPKIPNARAYMIRDMDRDTDVEFSSRTEATGDWVKFWEQRHYGSAPATGGLVKPKPASQHRPCVVMSSEEENPNCPGGFGGRRFFNRQYRFKIKGPGKLGRIITLADTQDKSFSVTDDEDGPVDKIDEVEDDFEYAVT